MDSDHYNHNPIHPANPAGKWDSDNDSNTRLAAWSPNTAFQQVLEVRHSVLLTWMVPPINAGTTPGRMAVPAGFNNGCQSAQRALHSMLVFAIFSV